MIKRLIRNVRQKPKAVRDQIALVTASMFTAVVGFVWLYNLPSRLPDLQDPITVNKDEQPAFSGFFSSMKDQLAAIKESSNETASTTVETVIPNQMLESASINEIASTTASSSQSLWVATTSVVADPVTPTVTNGENERWTFAKTASQTPEVSRSIRIVTTNNNTTTTATSSINQ